MMHHQNVRFEVFTAVTMKNGVFLDVTPCGSCKNQIAHAWCSVFIPEEGRSWFLQDPCGITSQTMPFFTSSGWHKIIYSTKEFDWISRKACSCETVTPCLQKELMYYN
jgi:hypothetical protein